MTLHSNKVKAKIIKSTFACQRDGLTIRGTEYRPEGDCLPIAIVSHGFMAFQDTVRQYAVVLAEMGYVSYCFDFCGGCVIKGKSDGSTAEMSVLTEVKDLEAVIRYARGREYSNPEEILLMGCSQGGFVSAIAASKLNGIISKLVMFYPALCCRDGFFSTAAHTSVYCCGYSCRIWLLCVPVCLFPRAMSQAAVLARPVGECREGQIPRCSAALQD